MTGSQAGMVGGCWPTGVVGSRQEGDEVDTVKTGCIGALGAVSREPAWHDGGQWCWSMVLGVRQEGLIKYHICAVSNKSRQRPGGLMAKALLCNDTGKEREPRAKHWKSSTQCRVGLANTRTFWGWKWSWSGVTVHVADHEILLLLFKNVNLVPNPVCDGHGSKINIKE